MYILLLPIVFPLFLLGILMGVAWWEDLVLPDESGSNMEDVPSPRTKTAFFDSVDSFSATVDCGRCGAVKLTEVWAGTASTTIPAAPPAQI